jgi:hypothetical protein
MIYLLFIAPKRANKEVMRKKRIPAEYCFGSAH